MGQKSSKEMYADPRHLLALLDAPSSNSTVVQFDSHTPANPPVDGSSASVELAANTPQATESEVGEESHPRSNSVPLPSEQIGVETSSKRIRQDTDGSHSLTRSESLPHPNTHESSHDSGSYPDEGPHTSWPTTAGISPLFNGCAGPSSKGDSPTSSILNLPPIWGNNLPSTSTSWTSPPIYSPPKNAGHDQDLQGRKFPLEDIQEASLMRYYIEEIAHWVELPLPLLGYMVSG
jgi:hypothetical protein